MNIYVKKQWWKLSLFIFAILIGAASLIYTNLLVNQLAVEEHTKVELWAEATRQIATTEVDGRNLHFYLKVIQNNRTIPLILADSEDNINSYLNLDTTKVVQKKNYLQEQLEIMKEENPPIEIAFGDGDFNYIYFKNSILLKKLTWYPLIQLGVILLFIFVSYFAFSISRRAEENKVWVGLTKETAHQLGTPTSSLMAWVEMLKTRNNEPEIAEELEKDVSRLEKIADRFSKVGSKPKLQQVPLFPVVESVVSYLKNRSSRQVQFIINETDNHILSRINPPLFEWVIENVCKNAIDALGGEGNIELSVIKNKTKVYLDIKDNGKGIAKNHFKSVFKPGFTTKSRGWGLGLSLSKRIIEQYHNGKIFVLESEIDKGTTIRIALPL